MLSSAWQASALLVLLTVGIAIGAWILIRTLTASKPSECEKRQDLSASATSVFCPVHLNDGPKFSGAKACFHVGRHRTIDFGNLNSPAFTLDSGQKGRRAAFTNGVMSLEVGRGYTLTAYEREGFAGKRLIMEKGVYKFTTEDDDDSLPMPGSLRVGLDRSKYVPFLT